MLPSWLNKNRIAPCPCCAPPTFKKNNYLKKTITAARNFMDETFLQEKSASKKGLLQKIDVRLKFVCTIALIILLSATHDILLLLVAYLFLLMLANLSKIEVRSFVLRSILTIGFFSLLVMLPASLNIFIEGKVLLRLGASLAVTDNGLRFLFLFSLRAQTMASAATLLLITTKREELLLALRAIRVPATFVLIISISYRFIAMLVRVVENLHLAKRSRTIILDDAKEGRRWVASRIGWTFSKAVYISNEVTQAMISRGWQGE